MVARIVTIARPSTRPPKKAPPTYSRASLLRECAATGKLVDMSLLPDTSSAAFTRMVACCCSRLLTVLDAAVSCAWRFVNSW